MGTPLFGRQASLDVGGLLISSTASKTGEPKDSLRIKFKIVRSTKKEPNNGDIEIYNLKKENRASMQESGLVVDLHAGYEENISQIFLGELEHANHALDGRNWITRLQADDSGQEYRASRINLSMAGPVQIGDVLQAAADALGVEAGNIADKVSAGSLRGDLTEFVNGIVLSGKTEQQLSKVLKSMGYSWSIQSKQLQVLGPEETLGDQTILLSSTTGLIGVPEAGEKGLVKARGLLQPEILPGKKVELSTEGAESLNGVYRVEKATFVGDTWGSDWYVDIEGKPVT